jgi:ABC-2 type transport system permease protein
MGAIIHDEGGQYFGFVVLGMMATLLINSAVNSLPGSVASDISRGTLEAMLSTPTSWAQLLPGMIGATLLWTMVKVIVLFVGGLAFGAPMQLASSLSAALILVLTLAAYLPIGLLAAALVLLFRTAGPLPQGVTYLSILLGGVYYPTHVIPDWIQGFSAWVPLTYSLRALRRVLLEGMPLYSVMSDLVILAAFAIALFALGCFAFSFAFGYAKKAGTLAHY